ncbi:SGNH/GDSL hydrolase family protein [Kordiimonas gwangyangensis]|nr:SGNH/GDSL hydrolase family protein [Kordiimonas gwangyangensis]
MVFGDSHVAAVQDAFGDYSPRNAELEISVHARARKTEDGGTAGDTPQAEFFAAIRDLDPADIIISMTRGNFHNFVSLVQHPVPFDFQMPGEDCPEGEATLIPFKVLEGSFEIGLRRDLRMMVRIKEGSKAAVFQLAPPPPKGNLDLIRQYPGPFKKLGLLQHGLSAPSLRVKVWRLYNLMLKRLCDEVGVIFVPVPDGCQGEDGCLKLEYYAPDATHANGAYGRLLLEQIEGIASGDTNKIGA